jgi:CRP-like cAMP-binding protein
VSIQIALLRDLELFAGLNESELELLRHHVKLHEWVLGDTLFVEGDIGSGCFCLVDGQVSVYLNKEDGEEALASLQAGASIGHFALIDGKRRSATCRVTSEKAMIIELTRETFDQLFSAQTSFAFKVMDNLVMDLVRHLRGNNDRLLTANRQRNQAKINSTTGRFNFPHIDTGSIDVDNIDTDSIEVCVPTLDQRMRDRRDK